MTDGWSLLAVWFLAQGMVQCWPWWLGYSVWTIRMAAINGARVLGGLATAALFGLWVVVFWEILVRALDVPRVLLPAPAW
jgi:hypothetical protein